MNGKAAAQSVDGGDLEVEDTAAWNESYILHNVTDRCQSSDVVIH